MRTLIMPSFQIFNAVMRMLGIVLINLTLFIFLLIATDKVLGNFSEEARLPVNGFQGGTQYTWGHPVQLNSLGFREREFQRPKPPGTYRVMVLGDSLTWGVGLKENERYTNLTEHLLSARFPGRDIEVLNFGISGLPTLLQARLLEKYIGVTNPDLIVVGFCFNDPQPRSQNYSVERESLDRKASPLLNQFWLLSQWLPHLGKRLEQMFWQVAEYTGAVPYWWEALDRTYRADSVEWQAFSLALQGIHALSNRMNLPAPIFMVLNQGSSTTAPTDYGNPDELLKLYLTWYEKAEHQAALTGFRTFNHEAEFAGRLAGEVLGVNRLDGHPSARENRIYAEKLTQAIAAEPDLLQPHETAEQEY